MHRAFFPRALCPVVGPTTPPPPGECLCGSAGLLPLYGGAVDVAILETDLRLPVPRNQYAGLLVRPVGGGGRSAHSRRSAITEVEGGGRLATLAPTRSYSRPRNNDPPIGVTVALLYR